LRYTTIQQENEEIMSCPNIYLGTGRFGAGPLAANYANDSIILASYDVQVSTAVSGQLRVNNHGTDDSPSTHVELYWSDPATNFAAVASRLILDTNTIIPGAAVGGSEGEFLTSWSYSFPTVGHYCLLARVENNSPPAGACVQQGYNSSSPPTDPQSAIHNINVLAPPPPPPSPGPGGPGGGGGGGGFMGFAFAAMNMQRDVQKTFLEVHALDPVKDREKLQHIVSIRGIDRLLSRRQVKFTLPNALHLGEGRERLLYRPEHFVKDSPAHCVPRMHTRGEVDAATIQRLLLPGTKLMEAKGKHEIDLLYGEARQTFIQVERCGKERAAYAVEVAHKAADGRNIGGLICIFVPPHDYF
jgi:hypothetical protein